MRARKTRTNAHLVTLTESERFFYENAPYSWDSATENATSGRTRAAIQYANSEKIMRKRGFWVTWEHDPEPWDGDDPYDGNVWVATLHAPCSRHVTCDCCTDTYISAGGIGIDSNAPEQSNSGRIIAAELMDQYLDGG